MQQLTLLIRSASAIVLLLALTPVTAAQSQPRTFEVASVKRSTTNRYVHPDVAPQSFRIVAPLFDAILWAYDIESYQTSGVPSWLNRDYYEIEGTAEARATMEEIRTMLQTLLAVRFNLKVHRESKEMSVYALIVGKGGPRLRSSTDSCGSGGCIDVGPGELIARYATMTSTAATLSNLVDRPVLDQTNLGGRYDFRVKFDSTSVKPYDGQPNVPPSAGQPSIFTVFEDLAVKLEPRRAQVEILVIDRADEPSAN